MNRPRLKAALAAAASLLAILAIVAYVFAGFEKDRYYDFARYVDKACRTRAACEVELSEIYKGDWDDAYYFRNGAGKLFVQREVGTDVNSEFEEFCSHLVFTRAKAVTGYDEDCTISNESDWDLFASGRRVYSDALVWIDIGNVEEGFLKMPRAASRMCVARDHVDAEGRTVYIVRRCPAH